jgi:uncharacterized protein YkwD
MQFLAVRCPFSPRRRVAALVRMGSAVAAAAGLLSLGLLVWSPVAAHADTASDAAAFLANTNQERSAYGDAGLTSDSALTGIAQGWSQEMASSDHLSDDPNLVSKITAAIPRWQEWGANVGTGATETAVQAAFVHSAAHFRNMVDPAFTLVGIAVSRATDGALFVAVDFLQLEAPPGPAAATASMRSPAPVAALVVPIVRTPSPLIVAPPTVAPAALPPTTPAPEAEPPTTPALSLHTVSIADGPAIRVAPHATSQPAVVVPITAVAARAAVPSPRHGGSSVIIELFAAILLGGVAACGARIVAAKPLRSGRLSDVRT